MTTAFHRAASVLVGNQERAESVIYTTTATGETQILRAIRSAPTAAVNMFGVDISSATTSFRVRQADVANPVAGDIITLSDATSYQVQAGPKADALAIWWDLDVAPA
ncbi:MAG: hypothetical protein ABT940_07235 [Alphaproteobacteria bacterium]